MGVPMLEVPPYVRPEAILAEAALALLPPERLTVSECAERHRRLGGGPWTFDRTPYTREPMDALGSGRYRLVVVMGPAQSGKSEIPNNWLLWTVVASPANLLWLQTDKAMMRDWVASRIEPMVRDSQAMRRRHLEGSATADTLYYKQFAGCHIWFGWPVPAQLQARSAARFVGDDVDRFPDSIGGEGDWLTLLEARQTAHEARAVGYAGSSPAKGRGRGIEGLYESGTRKAWHWPCPHCDSYFEGDYEHQARFHRGGTADEAQASAALGCPCCGVLIEPRYKAGMNERGLWLASGQSVTAEGEVAGEPPASSVDSYRIDGAIGLASWGELARRWRAAELAFEGRQDEEPLRSFFNTGLGKNYMPRTSGAEALEESDVAARCGGYQLGQVPEGVVVLTAAVDIQADRFEVAVVGWGEGLESWLIARFPLLQCRDGRTRIQPATYPEHWAELLDRVLWSRWPAPGGEMPIYNTALDTGGAEGVSENAKKFWRTARAAGVADQSITLVKGGGNPRREILPAATYLEHRRNGGPNRRGARLWVPNVNRIKSVINQRLRRPEPGPGYIHLPADLSADYVAELTAEERDAQGQWRKRNDKDRNETLDLLVYAYVALIRPPGAGERSDLAWVPGWARASTPPAPPAPQPETAEAAERRPDEPEANAVRPRTPPQPGGWGAPGRW